MNVGVSLAVAAMPEAEQYDDGPFTYKETLTAFAQKADRSGPVHKVTSVWSLSKA